MSKKSKEFIELIKIYKKLHKYGTDSVKPENIFDGKSLKDYIIAIKLLINKYDCKSIIDFGCGKAKLYNKNVIVDNVVYKNVLDYWKIKDHILYDPAYYKYKAYPSEKKDCVICTDVIEHIPPQDVIQLIKEIFMLANKAVFLNIAGYKANKYLPDGRNVHLSIKPSTEWKKIIGDIKLEFPNIYPIVTFSSDWDKHEIISEL